MFSGSDMSAVSSLYPGVLSPGSMERTEGAFPSPTTPHAAKSNLSSPARPLEPESITKNSGLLLPPSAGSLSVKDGLVARRSTELEGLYRGLPSRLIALRAGDVRCEVLAGVRV
jgi:hypothetical protein